MFRLTLGKLTGMLFSEISDKNLSDNEPLFPKGNADLPDLIGDFLELLWCVNDGDKTEISGS